MDKRINEILIISILITFHKILPTQVMQNPILTSLNQHWLILQSLINLTHNPTHPRTLYKNPIFAFWFWVFSYQVSCVVHWRFRGFGQIWPLFDNVHENIQYWVRCDLWLRYPIIHILQRYGIMQMLRIALNNLANQRIIISSPCNTFVNPLPKLYKLFTF